MRCSEIIKELQKLRWDINFYKNKATDKGKVAKKIYGAGRYERFLEGLDQIFGHILTRENWVYIDKLIEELQDPDIELLTELPFSEEFLKKL